MMATLKLSTGPYQRATRSTSKIMLELSACLGVVFLYSIIFYWIKAGYQYGLGIILMMLVAILTTNLVDVVTALIMHKKGNSFWEEIKTKLSTNYSYVTAIIFVLALPAYSYTEPLHYYVVIVGSIFATAIKNCFGGFGKNIFNPAVISRILVGYFFSDVVSFSTTGLDAVGGATVTTLINDTTNYIGSGSSIIPTGYSLFDLLFGNYYGAIGETCTVLLLVICVYLCIRRVINWRTPVFMIGTSYIIAFVVGLAVGIHNPFEYGLIHISIGGLVFGAVFMLTDPVTGPTSQFGKCLTAVFVAMMSMVIRLSKGSNYPEGVVFAIALSNMISPLIDALCVGRNNHKNTIKYIILSSLIVVSIGLNVGVALYANNGRIKSNDTSLNINNNDVNNSFELLTYDEGGNK